MSLVNGADQKPSPGVFIAPLSFAQKRLWFLSQLHPKSCAYNVPFGLRIRGPLDVAALHRTLAFIVHRHESLQTTFREIDGGPQQVIAPGAVVTLDLVDTTDDPEKGLEKFRLSEASTPFDLETGPLIRFKLLRLRPDDHALLITLHHIVSDGWSAGVIIREVLQAYESFKGQTVPSLPDLPIQYADFANWQLEYFTGEILRDELAYWKHSLSGAPRLLEIPTEFQRPKENTFAGRTEELALDTSLVKRIQEFCRENRVTPFMFYTACFNALLARYTGQTDIVLGTPVANRDRSELQGLVGFVANTVLLRTKFSTQDSFLNLLQAARSATLDALDHQLLPFDKLVEELQPERASGHNPLFQVLIGVYDHPSGIQRVGETEFEVMDTLVRTAKFDLSFYIVEGASATWKIEYSTELFSRSYIQRLLGHLLAICHGALARPEIRINQIPLLNRDEEQLILHDWNATEMSRPETTLHSLFEQQCARTPDADALVFEGEKLSYRELNARANRLGQLLRTAGVTRGMFVGVCMERSFEMVIALLGILKAGGAYVPIDPNYPADRVQFMLEDAAVAVLLTQSRLLPHLAGYEGATICVDQTDELTSFSSEAIAPVNSPDDLAYCIYTSGSTGKPKGAMNTHRGICNRLLWGQESYPITTEDRVVQKTPFSFDVSVWEFFWPLVTGATLVIAKPGGHKDPAYLIDLINRERITTSHFVPSMLQAFLHDPAASSCRSLKRVICSGEALSIETQEKFFTALDCELLNFYGPTEASVEVTHWRCERDSELHFVPIGNPIANTQIYILNDAMQPAPVLVPGELFIGGTGVARGYHNRDDLTAERFLPDPFRPGHRLYKTGDRARFLPDGTIQYLGRLDHQVKIRGFRIELEEIESVLRQHPLVRDAVVISREVNHGTHLVAYFVGYPSLTVGTESLQTFLKTRLPEYMVPGFFVSLAQIPLSPSGKVHRRALPSPDLQSNRKRADFAPPRNPVEEKLAQIWCEVLHLERAGIHDNFFDLGGHSLLATQLVSRIKLKMDAHVPLSRFFELPTIAQLGKEIGSSRSERIAAAGSDVSRLLNKLDQLSPAEVDALLQKEMG